MSALPAYIPRPRSRPVAFDDHQQPPAALETLRGADYHVSRLLAYRRFGEVAARPDALITATRNRSQRQPEIASIRFGAGRATARVFASTAWGYAYPSEGYQRMLQVVGDHLGTGTPTTPGGTGMHTLLAHLVGRHYALPVGARELLRDHLVGGRAETPGPGRYEQAWRLDRIGAYLQIAQEPLPVGTCRLLRPEEPLPWYGEFFIRCRVRIRHDLSLGPIPYRPRRTTLWPSQAGEYETWLWSCQVQDCLDAGLAVVPLGGLAWDVQEPVLRPWASWSLERIATAGPYRGEVKRSLLSAIGVQACDAVLWRILPESLASPMPDEALICYDGQPTSYVAQREVRTALGQVHWASCIYARQMSALYRMEQVLQAANHTVLYTNFDEIVTREQPDGTPGWKIEQLTHLTIPTAATRTYVCDQYHKTPGVPH